MFQAQVEKVHHVDHSLLAFCAYISTGYSAGSVCNDIGISVCTAGQYVGSIVSLPLSAVLCKYGFDGGWPSVFYVFGT